MSATACDGCRRPREGFKTRRAEGIRDVRRNGKRLDLCRACRQLSLEEWADFLAKKLGLKPIVNSDMSRWLDEVVIASPSTEGAMAKRTRTTAGATKAKAKAKARPTLTGKAHPATMKAKGTRPTMGVTRGKPSGKPASKRAPSRVCPEQCPEHGRACADSISHGPRHRCPRGHFWST